MKVKGIVELISDERIEGWTVVYNSKDEVISEPEVELKVNGKLVATTFAVRNTKHKDAFSAESGFKFNIKDLFNYLNEDDEIVISVNNESLPIYGHGLSYKCKTKGIYNFNDLYRRLEAGYVFDINGELKPSLKQNKKLRKKTIELYLELKKIFYSYFSYQLYACYGTLLGIVREKNFIFNDANFDCAYLSKETNKINVVKEFKYISKVLINNGYNLNVFNSHIQVRSKNSNAYINIYCSWLDDNFRYLLSFDYIGDEFINDGYDFEFITSELFGYQIIIPKSHDDILRQIYGHKWFLTDYGFRWKNSDKKEKFLKDSEVNEIYWEQYYLNISRQAPSSFCLLINEKLNKEYFIIDIGCGSARDSIEFVKHGHTVMGLDNSEEAIRFANSLVKEQNHNNVTFHVANVTDKNRMYQLLKQVKNYAKQNHKNIVFYSRFFLHSIDESSQKALLEIISKYTEEGDLFAAEFRTIEDKKRQKIYSNHYRRFINEKELIIQLDEICKMNNILLFQKGTGFSIYKDEDPFLGRLIVRKD